MIENNELWVEKYRPKTLNEVVIDDACKSMLENFIRKQSIPHCLFVGTPGTGKTTIALILKNEIIKHRNDFLFLNASDERGINSIRNTVIEFMKVPPIQSPHKLVIMDESDNLTNDAWMVLRNPIENDDFNTNQQTRFVFTANYLSKIPQFMQSRCAVFEFKTPPMSFAIQKAKDILSAETVEYSDDVLISLVNACYPDLRSTINTLQRSTITSEDGVNKLSYEYKVSYSTELYSLVDVYFQSIINNNTEQQSATLTKIRTMLRMMDVNVIEVCKQILDEIILPPEMYIVVNRYMNKFNSVVDESHHFIAMLYECLLQHLRMGK